MPFNPKSAENLLKIEPLPEGIKSGVTRVRAKAEAFGWWSGLTAAERGEMVEQLHQQQKVSGVTPDKKPAQRRPKPKPMPEGIRKMLEQQQQAAPAAQVEVTESKRKRKKTAPPAAEVEAGQGAAPKVKATKRQK